MAYQEPLDVGQGSGVTNIKKKHHSCWTFTVDSTVSKPNLDTTLLCLTKYYARKIRKSAKKQQDSSDDIFLDKYLPLDENFSAPNTPPTAEEIYEFLYPLFNAAGLTAENAVIMMVYIERMLEHSGVFMTPLNWKRIMLGGLLMASKVWDDQAIWNVDFCSILPGIEVQDMNELERFYLLALQFNVSVKASVFAAHYFNLREFARKNNSTFDLQPLSEADARELEAQTAVFDRAVNDKFGSLKDRSFGQEFALRKAKSENMFVGKPATQGIM